ncbi:hypothetical protein TRIATDRAFT_302368 [Trichoderma atroviride IMI 206040]|uniref:Uncharacterized protein n=1 Tax=Hypocrea atroviridis (strain ATCC 20476 / IMI 206040) TaxID=452589 RepID=G9P5G1_HYPAI|nr:uncharacterized protein TRIATDRAFT_302368 [Trichoderma atroviride IMI 206040]EHK42132.1 hypothetical protein TRIATDRAFT_302368 [Trichoderma atroviride IMI 206040]
MKTRRPCQKHVWLVSKVTLLIHRRRMMNLRLNSLTANLIAMLRDLALLSCKSGMFSRYTAYKALVIGTSPNHLPYVAQYTECVYVLGLFFGS